MTKNIKFKRSVMLGTQNEFNNRGDKVPAKVFCTVVIEEGDKLSISGVIGPKSNGDCLGSCGQIYDSIDLTSYAEGWDKESVSKFIDVWKNWHLNDMKAYTPDMKNAGWDDLASKEIFKFSYSRTDAAQEEFKQLERALIDAGIDQVVCPLNDRQKRLLKSERWITLYAYTKPQDPEFMELQIDYRTKMPKIESKTLGWLSITEHPDGLLGRELNGEKYGCKWYKHDLPQDIIDYIHALPAAKESNPWRD